MQTPVTEGLQALAAAALRSIAVYDSLSGQLQGKQKMLSTKLRQQQMETVWALKGIYRLASGGSMRVKAEKAELENTEPALRKNYGRSLKALAAYEQRSEDAEFGALFAALAEGEREHCRGIAELMGMLQV